MAIITGNGFTYVVPADPVKYAALRREREARRDALRGRRFKSDDEKDELLALEETCRILANNDPANWSKPSS